MSSSGEDFLTDSSDYELGPLGFDTEGEDSDVPELDHDQDGRSAHGSRYCTRHPRVKKCRSFVSDLIATLGNSSRGIIRSKL